jgi:hypothetical protein
LGGADSLVRKERLWVGARGNDVSSRASRRYPRSMEPYVWDEWPQFFRGRLRVLYEELGDVTYQPRPRLPWWRRHRRWWRVL